MTPEPPASRFVTLAADQLAGAVAEAVDDLGGMTGDVLALAGGATGDAAERATESALRRLQAIDRLQQRVCHVEQNLRDLAALLAAGGGPPANGDWNRLLADCRGRYTTEAERAQFDGAEIAP